MNDPSDNKPGAGGRFQQFIGFMSWALTGLWGLMRQYHTQGLEPAANNATGDDIGNNRNQGGTQNVGEVNVDANADRDRVRVGYNSNDNGDQTIGSVKIKRRRSP